MRDILLELDGHKIISELEKDNYEKGYLIEKQAKEGNKLAVEVIKAYKFWYDCPGDSVAEHLFRVAYHKWKVGTESVNK